MIRGIQREGVVVGKRLLLPPLPTPEQLWAPRDHPNLVFIGGIILHDPVCAPKLEQQPLALESRVHSHHVYQLLPVDHDRDPAPALIRNPLDNHFLPRKVDGKARYVGLDVDCRKGEGARCEDARRAKRGRRDTREGWIVDKITPEVLSVVLNERQAVEARGRVGHGVDESLHAHRRELDAQHHIFHPGRQPNIARDSMEEFDDAIIQTPSQVPVRRRPFPRFRRSGARQAALPHLAREVPERRLELHPILHRNERHERNVKLVRKKRCDLFRLVPRHKPLHARRRRRPCPQRPD
mmetsp:Transcript_48122/g.114391  ORF Transcript_48122/g.114391 Transcript_48122/m.114391 type:complete len:295 (+) Transcript_48122:490-1374(+)